MTNIIDAFTGVSMPFVITFTCMMRAIRHRSVLTLLWAFCGLGMLAQSRIDGTYDPKYKAFIPHVNLLNNGMDPRYRVDKLVHGYGAIEDKNAKLIGVIDSTGQVCVPIAYVSLESCSAQPGYFVFHREGKTGLVNRMGVEMCTIASGGKGDDRNRLVQSKLSDLFFVFVNDKVGLFNARRNTVVVPAIYDRTNFLNDRMELVRRKHAWISLVDSIAIVKKGDTLFIHDLDQPRRSQPYRDIVVLNNGQFFLQSFNGFAAVSADYINPVNTLDFRVLDTYNDCVLGRKSTGYGVTTADGKEVIPFVYEDIYFVSKNALWLKKDGLWALAGYQHNLFTPFVFDSIETTNDWFVHQLLEVTHLDTTGGNLLIERDYPGINDAPTDLKTLIYQVERLATTKRTYNTVLEGLGGTNRAAAHRADGWHFLYPPLGTVEPEAWEEVRYVPNWIDPYGLMAYRLKGKWGVEAKEIDYDAVLYDALELAINCTNECIIKKGYIYSYVGNPRYSTTEKCVWEKQIKLEEYVVR